jgi:SAM-dependent methyltransferase
MFWDDIVLVTEQIEKYGLRHPFVDLGGMERPCIADYGLTIATSDQCARYVSLEQRPFDHIDPDYMILNPDKGDPGIEDLPYSYRDRFGTAVCLNVIEHVKNPFRVFAALYQIMHEESLLIIETVFSFPYHPSPDDYWRYSPDCLRYISEQVGFTVLECDWRNIIPADMGIRNTAVGVDEAQEIRSIYATLAKGALTPKEKKHYPLPPRFSQNPRANEIIRGEGLGQISIATDDKPVFDPLEHHNLHPDVELLMLLKKNPGSLGIAQELSSLPVTRQNDLLIGEYYADLSRRLGTIASEFLLKAQWGYCQSEWFDHRHHFLNPATYANDYWAMSADLVLLKLPLEGKVLDLCAGDGFYDFHFFSRRASEVVSLELSQEAHRQAVRLHRHPNIRYLHQDILTYVPPADYFDIVVIRGAIEHFTRDEQHKIFNMAHHALKSKGWFCGDTPANSKTDSKQLDAHENEWKDEDEMRAEISTVFPIIETLTFRSHKRVTLFWQAQKELGRDE